MINEQNREVVIKMFKVVDSCKTPEHYMAAGVYCELARTFFVRNSSSWTEVEEIMQAIRTIGISLQINKDIEE